jgi:hypothetical protein
MYTARFVRKAAAVLAAAVLAVVLSTGVGFAASDFVGKYKTEDTQGKPMTITLAEDGAAAGAREDETLKGTWKEDGAAAVIKWEDGWTTTLTKEGDSYKKTASKEGEPEGAASEAQKVQ